MKKQYPKTYVNAHKHLGDILSVDAINQHLIQENQKLLVPELE